MEEFARHKVLCNSGVSKTSSGNTERPNDVTVSFQPQTNSHIPEKSELFRTEEKTEEPKPERELPKIVNDVYLKAILSNGHCFGGMNVLTNILQNSLAYLNSGGCERNEDSDDLSMFLPT